MRKTIEEFLEDLGWWVANTWSGRIAAAVLVLSIAGLLICWHPWSRPAEMVAEVTSAEALAAPPTATLEPTKEPTQTPVGKPEIFYSYNGKITLTGWHFQSGDTVLDGLNESGVPIAIEISVGLPECGGCANGGREEFTAWLGNLLGETLHISTTEECGLRYVNTVDVEGPLEKFSCGPVIRTTEFEGFIDANQLAWSWWKLEMAEGRWRIQITYTDTQTHTLTAPLGTEWCACNRTPGELKSWLGQATKIFDANKDAQLYVLIIPQCGLEELSVVQRTEEGFQYDTFSCVAVLTRPAARFTREYTGEAKLLNWETAEKESERVPWIDFSLEVKDDTGTFTIKAPIYECHGRGLGLVGLADELEVWLGERVGETIFVHVGPEGFRALAQQEPETGEQNIFSCLHRWNP